MYIRAAFGEMNRGQFRLSNEQNERISRHLPRDTRGSSKIDDQHVISDVLHVPKSICRWLMHH